MCVKALYSVNNELNCRYAIMWECWQEDPESRPTFLELGKTLHRLMTAQKVSITEARKRYKMYRFDSQTECCKTMNNLKC